MMQTTNTHAPSNHLQIIGLCKNIASLETAPADQRWSLLYQNLPKLFAAILANGFVIDSVQYAFSDRSQAPPPPEEEEGDSIPWERLPVRWRRMYADVLQCLFYTPCDPLMLLDALHPQGYTALQLQEAVSNIIANGLATVDAHQVISLTPVGTPLAKYFREHPGDMPPCSLRFKDRRK